MQDQEARYQAYVRERKQQPPKVLFRYMTTQAAEATLKTGTLRFTSPTHFNDPFDTQWDTMWETNTPAARERLAKRWRMLVVGDMPLARIIDLRIRRIIAKRKAAYERTPLSGRTKFLETEFEAAHTYPGSGMAGRPSDLIRRLRILCLAESGTAIPMWSHYSDHHRGVVLAFDPIALEQHWRIPVSPVRYEESLPKTVDLDKWLDAMTLGTAMPVETSASDWWVLTKAVGWKAEQEWRFSYLERPPGPAEPFSSLPFRPPALRSAFLGCRISDEAACRVEALAASRYQGVKVRRYKMSRFGLNLELVGTEPKGDGPL